MKFVIAICATSLLACTSVLRADDSEKKTEAKQQVGIQIRSIQKDSSGNVEIEVEETVNGKKKKYKKEIPAGKNGGAIQFQVITYGEEMPDHVQEMIQKLEAQAKKNRGKIDVSSFGSITVVGPDGKTTTKTFGGKVDDGKQIEKEVKDAVEKHLMSLPNVEIQIEDIEIPRFQFKPLNPTQQKIQLGNAALMKKLDVVLKRLEKIENELKELKEKD